MLNTGSAEVAIRRVSALVYFLNGTIVSIDPSGRYVSSVTLTLRRCVWPPESCASW